MAKTTPKVQGKQLYLNDNTAPLCCVGSPDWFDWLETTTTFRYFTDQRTPIGAGFRRAMYPVSLRKEKRRRQFVWYAYRRAHGQLYKRYVGKTTALTVERLDEIAAELNTAW